MGASSSGCVLGAQRRIEARIGQLLGDVEQGERTDLGTLSHAIKIIQRANDRNDFRLLAHGFDIPLETEEWRKSRAGRTAAD